MKRTLSIIDHDQKRSWGLITEMGWLERTVNKRGTSFLEGYLEGLKWRTMDFGGKRIMSEERKEKLRKLVGRLYER
jgi:hypothetical protein